MSTGTRIQHVNLMVDDLARAVEFYGTALGLATVPTPDMGFPAQFFKINDLQEIHLNQLQDVTPERAHFCLRVDDFTGQFRRMKELGALEVETWGKVRRLPSGVMQMFVRDPAGNLIELSCEADQDVDPAIFDEAIFEPEFLEAT
jgi:catechol 2,3-dioxygenase-like lactoylglutathione lyase family enzyme